MILRPTLAVVISATLLIAADPLTVASPTQRIVLEVQALADGQLSWSATCGGATVLAPAALGWEVDGVDLGKGATLGQPQRRSIDERYPVVGVHREGRNACAEAIIPVTSGALAWRLHLRAYDDGVALRYEIPAAGAHRITADRTTWRIPGDAIVWWSAYGYETMAQGTPLAGLPENKPLSPPLTVQLADGKGYLALTEADNAGATDMGILRQGDRLVATWPASAKGWNATGPVISPWRTASIAKDLDGLVNCDLLTSLCPPPRADLVGATWIKPGRALWHWWAVGDPRLDEQHAWVDAAAELGFEYYLVDDGWKKWKDGAKDSWTCLTEVADYARAKKVGILVWVACKDLWDAKARRAYLEKVAATGALGIKIDYFPPGHEGTVQWMEGALADTADLKLLCNFHGCVKPTGRNRTWPHEPTREAVRGHEWHIKRYKRVMPFDQYTIIPFTRFLLGPADFTPTVFDPSELLGYTWTNEMAQAIVFTSPVLHFADHYRFLLANPNRDLLTRIPVTWDETRVLAGSRIGHTVAMARRTGSTWFIGVMNGAEAATLDVDLGFLGDGRYRMERLADVAGKDDAAERSDVTVGRADHVALDLRRGGGSVAVLTPVK